VTHCTYHTICIPGLIATAFVIDQLQTFFTVDKTTAVAFVNMPCCGVVRLDYSIETCESEISVRIESRIESADSRLGLQLQC